MSETPPVSSDGPAPLPDIRRRAHVSLWLVWLVPLVAVVIGLGLAAKAILERGPEVTLYFRNGEGLEAGKTRIKYKDVEVGLVKRVRLTRDHQRVEVTAEMHRSDDVESLVVADTRFWVVRPRIGAGGVSGLGTLLSGAYIGMDAGHSTVPRRSFDGLDVQPIVTADVPGRQFVLRGDELGSLDIGSAVYFRRVPVGQVVAYELEGDGAHVRFTVFVAAPYDRFVTARSRFWQASGLDVGLDVDGIHLQTQSVASLLAGGIAFQDLDDDSGKPAPAAAERTAFRLFAQQEQALKQPDYNSFDYRLLFRSSVRGLRVGAPVDYRGLAIGEVTHIAVEGSAGVRNPNPQIAVDVRVYPSRLPTIGGPAMADAAQDDQRQRLDPMVSQGFRAQLRSGNLLTGQLYVALDFFPAAPRAQMNWKAEPPTLPTVPGSLDSLQDSLTRLATRLERLPLETIADDLHRALADLDRSLVHTDELVRHVDAGVAPEARDALAEARRTLDALRRTLGVVDQTLGPQSAQTLGEVTRAAQSLRALADSLERNPQWLIQGKGEDPK